MFFKIVEKNSRRIRKENGLLFLSLIVSIIAFYIILSLENQGVVRFLKTMESDAVQKLLLLIPGLYGVSLVILFFLLYFAGKYQLEKRNHEFGMYFMMGLRRSTLFQMLLLEEVYNSLLSLVIGIPVAVFLSEMISLITVKLVGIGVLGYECSFSLSAVLGTIAGYVLIRLAALMVLSIQWIKKEPLELLNESQEKKHKSKKKTLGALQFFGGIILLAAAYGLGIYGLTWEGILNFTITVTLGLCGTFLLFQGLSILFETLLNFKRNQNGLEAFNFRQIQEAVLSKANSLAVSSVLILIAIGCCGYGTAVTTGMDIMNQHTMDYTFQGEEQEICTQLEELGLNNYIKDLFEIRVGVLDTEEDVKKISVQGLIEAIEKQQDSEAKEITLENLQYMDWPYLISLSGYNHIMQIMGKPELTLGKNEIALYSDPEMTMVNLDTVMRKALQEEAFVKIGNTTYELSEEYCVESIVTDRAITISYGFIVDDETFERLIEDDYSSYWNAVLKEEWVEKQGMMQSICWMNNILNESSLEYESYLQNMGRNLFYCVAAGYTTIYMAIIFLIIANTVIGVQFLMAQQKVKKRYKTLVYLGSYEKELQKAARKQIVWYFSMPILVGAIGSVFGIWSLFSGMAFGSIKGHVAYYVMLSIPAIFLLLVVELIYVTAVMRISDKQIGKLMVSRREDS